MKRLPLACALLLLGEFPNPRIPDVIRARFRLLPLGLLQMGSSNRDPCYTEFSKENCNSRETTYFLEKDLKVGMNKILCLCKSEFSCASPFLSREDAFVIPFSSGELPRITSCFLPLLVRLKKWVLP
ncbi:hypothetical protein AMTR_s00041p00237250 [Amborella trichopoda]|uniref:Uncharacterized protein n=1 Tax=Amborella trichopoda TaxID=13333 RepID=W1PYX5_AMBTC|nr:hypothetical protein AMTR_s00041p00237250 [Amborella trichopoda]